jgi:hypothetical protein
MAKKFKNFLLFKSTSSFKMSFFLVFVLNEGVIFGVGVGVNGCSSLKKNIFKFCYNQKKKIISNN